MRKLASIQVIEAINPIPKADMLEAATILGWSLVVKKGEFKVGDSCIYVEVDSFLPIDPRFEFLRKGCLRLLHGREGFRIRTIRLRGQISQGLALPLSQFPECAQLNVGDDLTALLKIRKYDPYEQPEPPILTKRQRFIRPVKKFLIETLLRIFPNYFSKRFPTYSILRLEWPRFLRKTDETRIQAAPSVLDRHAGKEFMVTEKLDGTSCTIYSYRGKFGACSRNLERADAPDDIYWRMVRKYNLQELLPKLGNYAIQGEIIGPAIQQNKYQLSEPELFVFNIYDIERGIYLNYYEYMHQCVALGLKPVPQLEKLYLNHSVNDLVKYATRKSTINTEVLAEGIVMRPLKEERDQELGRLSFKVINPEFLLKWDE